jgi:ectoine hydroxylase-related dioxygenase (phytanoyl-CoA dioxygenase family)
MKTDPILQQIDRDGYAVLAAVFESREIETILHSLDTAFQTQQDSAIRSESGHIYAARNLLSTWPAVAALWQISPLQDVLADVLGTDYGLVRVLYFDKPPNQSWGLPWHKDMTIAVRDNRLPSERFGKPTQKAGVPHVEAPQELLERMLTARIHLDTVTEENGPLKVLPGSHRSAKTLSNGSVKPQTILVERGDVLLIRPLVEHCSSRSHPNTVRHRRILHLEFAADRELPDGYAWHDFMPASTAI